MKRFIWTILYMLLAFFAEGQSTDTANFFQKLTPDNIKLQFAGNIGFLSTGIGYASPQKHWKGDILYGFVPAKYAAGSTLHLLTLKGRYGTLDRSYSQNVNIQWINVGLWGNYAFGDRYFVRLPEYYSPGYYLIRPGLNIGVFVGSEIKYKNIGAYYELGTTDKQLIHFFKNLEAFSFPYMFSAAIGVIYHLNQ
ncbi:hypothetical protein G5B30_10345 [Sphingobacterium sp. SGG-5]|uniref:hypothetical protein n=1 Tax=Sphingobacterium sp. SGG-5 TaxID=2710881 RepID=UPI0013EE0CD6|nr:hypothetical protein [Sphingobacterium sp. SGG-5]NGM62312.1 hypothetical protein [Sphingobacterium sp. SGG-5]